MTPQRVQLQRKAGWQMPPNTVKVARPSYWGNPFGVDRYGREEALRRYRDYLTNLLDSPYAPDIGALRGKNLACWCKPDQACHADILLEFANRPEEFGEKSLAHEGRR